jgi:hypothetical protein
MAKVQGHLLKYRENAEECIEHAKELLQEDIGAAKKDMLIAEWLHRLNLLHLQKFFDD